jgi:SSS family solute:Na+ symporter
MMTVTMTIYGTMTIQKDNGFSTAARSAHEARMGGLLGWWRYMSRSAALVVIALGAMTLLRQPNFAGQATLNSIQDSQLQSQMAVPIALRYLLPVGVKGLFLTLMVLGLISGDASHMLTWGGIFIQDIVLPLRQTPMSPRQHVLVLRLALAGVALFAFLFSIFFHQTQYIVMWWAVTEGVFACGAGICIIGGLYWKKGTTVAAWSAFIVGSTLSLTYIAPSALQIIGIHIPDLPFNGKQVQFGAAGAAVLVYVIVSLCTTKNDFDLDRMLHRGKYALSGESAPITSRPSLIQRLGINDDFSYGDRVVAIAIFAWTMFWLGVTVVGTAWNLWHPWPTHIWASYWLVVGIILPMLVCVVTLFWFGIGGIIDIRSFFRLLASAKRDASDDGTVQRPPESAIPVLPTKSR